MEDRLVQIIKEKHLLTWKDGEDTGVGVGEYKLVFQHDDDIVIISELNSAGITDQTVSEFMNDYDKGEGYSPYDGMVSWEKYNEFLKGMENIYGEGTHETFKQVIHAMAEGGVTVDRSIRCELEDIYNDIRKILSV